MRKSLTGAIAAVAVLGLTTGAVAQDPEVALEAKVAPAKAGTKRKPKSSRFTFGMTVNLPTATVGTIRLEWPSTMKMSTRGFPRCDFDDLISRGTSACPRGSSAGPRGEAAAAVGPAAAPLNFDVNAFVEDNNTLLFYLNQKGGGVQSVVRGEIRGRRLSINIPDELRKPGGLDATLTGLDYTFTGKAGRNALVTTTGCRGSRHRLKGTLIFSKRVDGTAAPAPRSATVNAPCRK